MPNPHLAKEMLYHGPFPSHLKASTNLRPPPPLPWLPTLLYSFGTNRIHLTPPPSECCHRQAVALPASPVASECRNRNHHPAGQHRSTAVSNEELPPTQLPKEMPAWCSVADLLLKKTPTGGNSRAAMQTKPSVGSREGHGQLSEGRATLVGTGTSCDLQGRWKGALGCAWVLMCRTESCSECTVWGTARAMSPFGYLWNLNPGLRKAFQQCLGRPAC